MGGARAALHQDLVTDSCADSDRSIRPWMASSRASCSDSDDEEAVEAFYGEAVTTWQVYAPKSNTRNRIAGTNCAECMGKETMDPQSYQGRVLDLGCGVQGLGSRAFGPGSRV
eukprot:293056-Rhodomonas_salina.1